MTGLLVLGVLVLATLALPALWARHVMDRHRRPADRYPGTGAELARHLLERLGIDAVDVQQSDGGDHYDPARKVLRLAPGNYHGRSLTAVTVAAHEVAHAMQDRDGYPPLRWRSGLISAGRQAERIGTLVLLLAPVLIVVGRNPQLGLLFGFAGFTALFIATLTHLLTLPVEFDASFVRALPMLEQGGYLQKVDRQYARQLLVAAAMSYPGVALLSMLSLGRWLRWLRR